MGVNYYVGCRDCEVYRDLDKLRPSMPTTAREVKDAVKDLAAFPAALLIGFMAEHQGHNCTLFNDIAEQDDIANYRRDGKSELDGRNDDPRLLVSILANSASDSAAAVEPSSELVTVLPMGHNWGRSPVYAAKIGSGPSACIVVRKDRKFRVGMFIWFVELSELEGRSRHYRPPWRRGQIWKIDDNRLFVSR